MNIIDIAKGILFQKLNICNDSFSDRIIAQKKIYLLKCLGTDLGYQYNWYLRGPYSSSLSNYIYDNIEFIKHNDFNEYNLLDATQKNVDIVNTFIDSEPSSLETSSWYELLASMSYLDNNRESWNINNNNIIEILQREKPRYTTAECSLAIETLKTTNIWSQ